jgi:hypothetical protein
MYRDAGITRVGKDGGPDAKKFERGERVMVMHPRTHEELKGTVAGVVGGGSHYVVKLDRGLENQFPASEVMKA